MLLQVCVVEVCAGVGVSSLEMTENSIEKCLISLDLKLLRLSPLSKSNRLGSTSPTSTRALIRAQTVALLRLNTHRQHL